MRLAGRIALLVTLWLLAWGEITPANLISGIIVAGALLVSFSPRRRPGGHVRLNLVGAGRLAAHVARQLLLSNVVMAREVLRRSSRTQPGVLAHRLRRPSEEVVTVMTSVIALSPGTMIVDVAHDSSTVYVHFFRLTDTAAARAGLLELERLTIDAIGAAEAHAPNDAQKESP